MITFSGGAWVSIIPPKFTDPCWSKKDLLFYATIYAAASQTYDEKRALILAEVAVNKRLYPEIKYDSRIEAELQGLF
jgi:hypothetical protein